MAPPEVFCRPGQEPAVARIGQCSQQTLTVTLDQLSSNFLFRIAKTENKYGLTFTKTGKFNTVPELCSLCLKMQIFLQAYKFKKIQGNSGKFNTVPKPPAGPVCIPSVVNCNFFFAGNNCQVLCFTSGGGCLAKGYIYVPHTSTYMYTYLEYIRYTLEYILRPFLCGSRHATPAGICQKYVYVLQGGSQLVRF